MRHPIWQRVCVPSFMLTVAALAVAFGSSPAAGAGPERAMRLRFEWGSGTPKAWSGVLEVDAGRFESPASLGIEADEPGTLWIDRGAVWLRRRSARVFDGFDVTVVASPTAQLSLTLQPTAEGEPERIKFQLDDLLAGPRSYSTGGSDLRFSVRRAPGDELRLDVERPHLVFAPGEAFAVSVLPNIPALLTAAASVQIDWQFRSARSAKVVRAGSMRVAAPEAGTPVSANLEVPHDEGPYDLEIGYRILGQPRVASLLQLIVVAPHGAVSHDAAVLPRAPQPVLVDSFEPSKATFLRRVERRAGLRQWNETFRHMLQGTEAVPTGSEPKAQWSAYRLKVRRLGVRHRLVVTLPATVAQSVGISLLEPNAAGQLMPVGVDSGRHVTPRNLAPDASVAEAVTHEITCWPKITQPILLIHDFGTGVLPQVEKVELFEEELPSSGQRANDLSVPRRLVGPYLHKPMFAESFGATEALDEVSGRSLDDWQTFYEGGTRLVGYLNEQGYNSAMLAVLADGSTIYPSRLLEPTPRYDTGTYFTSAQDRMRKDGLELLFRLFSRDGLVLVPELQFSAPLAALERQLHVGGDAARGIELVGRDGRSWRESRPIARGLAPYYNPLDPKVQQAILDVVAEVANRYGHHPAYQGLAVELSSVGYLQLPGLDWGYDDATIARFETATGTKVPAAEGSERYAARHAFLTGTARDRWIRWRCEELVGFYRRLAETVAASKPGARLIIAGNRVLRGSNPDDSLYEAVKQGASLEALLAPKGLDFKLLSNVESISLLRPSVWGTADRGLGESLDGTVNYNSGLDSAFASRSGGILFYHLPRELRIAEFDPVSPWQPAYTWIVAQGVGSPTSARKRFGRALAAGDAHLVFEGSWRVRLGEESATRGHRELMKALPAVEFRLNETQQQPAVVRIARTSDRTYLYVVNDFPSTVDVVLKLSSPVGTSVRRLVDQTPLTLVAGAGESQLAVTLDAYGVWGCVLDDSTARVLGVEARLPSDALAALQSRIARFDQRMAEVHRQAKSAPAPLENPGFELSSEDGTGLPGWELKLQPAAEWALDRENPRSGQAALVLSPPQGEGTVSLSSSVPVEDHRLATMHVWLRSDRRDSAVRLLFEATVAGQPQARSAEVKVDDRWRRYSFRVTDLPIGRLEDSQVRVETGGPGKIWIDDVEVELQRLTADDLRQLTKVFSAVSLAWDEKRYADCSRLLESFWGHILMEGESRLPTVEPLREAKGTPSGKRG